LSIKDLEHKRFFYKDHKFPAPAKPKIDKTVREKVYNKFDGRCAYCGCKILFHQMHIDHIHPQSMSHFYDAEPSVKKEYGLRGDNVNHIDNLFPACRSCNNYKATFSIDVLRKELEEQPRKLRVQSIIKLCERFGIIEIKEKPIKFYFETIGEHDER